NLDPEVSNCPSPSAAKGIGIQPESDHHFVTRSKSVTQVNDATLVVALTEARQVTLVNVNPSQVLARIGRIGKEFPRFATILRALPGDVIIQIGTTKDSSILSRFHGYDFIKSHQ